MTHLPRNLQDLAVEFARRGNAAVVAVEDPEAVQPPGRRRGRADGWTTAHRLIQEILARPYDDEAKALEQLAATLDENRRRTVALTHATVSVMERTGRAEALSTAADLTQQTAQLLSLGGGQPPAADPEPDKSPPEADPDDLSDWSGYPVVPVVDVGDISELCLFLGGDSGSFTGDLIKLIAKADPGNLNRLAQGFPRHVRAYLMWRACAPVPARTLVALLEASSTFERRAG